MKSVTKKRILILSLFGPLLLPSCLFAQQPSGCVQPTQLHSEYVVAQGEPTALHLKFKSHDCHMSVGWPSPEVWLSSDADSFAVNTHERGYGKIRTLDGKPDSRVTDEIELSVAVTPVSGIPPGHYQIPAVLNYQAVDASGNTVQQSTQVVIPVTVKPIIAHSGSNSQPHPWKTVGTYIGVVALFPLWVLSSIVYFIGTGSFPDC